MAPYFQDESVTLYCADCRTLALEGITAVVTDPPYELGFMGKEWDRQGVSFDPETWHVISSLCLPGAPLLAFGGTRTWHRIVCAIEDAGWEIRDSLMWLYGSGFPKSLDISKAIDKALGCEQVIGSKPDRWTGKGVSFNFATDRPQEACKVTAPATDAAKEWQGYGTALKPAWEPICLAMKPLDGTFAHNALTHGVAGLNIDGCRIGTESIVSVGPSDGGRKFARKYDEHGENLPQYHAGIPHQGRFPANLLLDEISAAMLDEQSGERKDGTAGRRSDGVGMFNMGGHERWGTYGGFGGASRFFYCAKASRAERDRGCEGLENGLAQKYGSIRQNCGSGYPESTSIRNDHPTVKPLALMEYLVKLVMPPKGGVILDPFMGSGTTGLACQKLGVRFIGVDISERNCEIAARRLQRSKVLC